MLPFTEIKICYLFDFHSFLTSVVFYTKSRSCITTFNALILKYNFLKENTTWTTESYFFNLKVVMFSACCRNYIVWINRRDLQNHANPIKMATNSVVGVRKKA